MPPRRYAVVYQGKDARKDAMETIQAAVAMFGLDKYTYSDTALDTAKPPAGIYDYIAFFGGHGDVNAGAPADMLGKSVAAWDVWVDAAVRNGVRAKHLVLDCCLSAAFIRNFSPLLATAEMPLTACTITCSISSSYGTLPISSGRMLGESITAKMQDEWDLVGARAVKYKFATGATVPPILANCDIDGDTVFMNISGQWKVGDFTVFKLATAYGENGVQAEQAVVTASTTGVLVIVPGGSSARFIPRSVYSTRSQTGGTLYRCGGFTNTADEEAAFNEWESKGGGAAGAYSELTGMMTYLEGRGITIEKLASISQLKNAADTNIRVVG